MMHLLDSLMDVFQNHTLSMIQLTVCLLALFALLYDFFYSKRNKLSKRILQQIGGKKKEKRSFRLLNLDRIYDRFSGRLGKVEKRVEEKLAQANLDFTPKEYSTFLLIGTIAGAVLGFVIFPFSGVFKGMLFFLSSPFLKLTFARLAAAVIFAYVGSLFPKFWVYRLGRKRSKELESQLQEALMSIADGLQSGLTPQQAIKTVGDEMPEPIGEEFRMAYQDLQVGKSFNEAMENLKMRVNVTDFSMAVNAMQIQNEAGGRLEDLLRNMVRIIQERMDTRNEIRKTIANQRMVGIILLCAPFAFLFIFSSANEDTYTAMFSSAIGWVLVVVAGISYAIAAWLIIGIMQYVNKGV